MNTTSIETTERNIARIKFYLRQTQVIHLTEMNQLRMDLIKLNSNHRRCKIMEEHMKQMNIQLYHLKSELMETQLHHLNGHHLSNRRHQSFSRVYRQNVIQVRLIPNRPARENSIKIERHCKFVSRDRKLPRHDHKLDDSHEGKHFVLRKMSPDTVKSKENSKKCGGGSFDQMLWFNANTVKSKENSKTHDQIVSLA